MEFPACLYNCVLDMPTDCALSKSASAKPIKRQHSFGVSFRIRIIYSFTTTSISAFVVKVQQALLIIVGVLLCL